eukprot:scaffold17988_cov136-Isochrysis_galbana.AAC.7
MGRAGARVAQRSWCRASTARPRAALHRGGASRRASIPSEVIDPRRATARAGERDARARRDISEYIFEIQSSSHSHSQHVSHRSHLSVSDPGPLAEPGPQRSSGAGAWWRSPRVSSASIYSTFNVVPTTGRLLPKMSKDNHLLPWNGQSGDTFREWATCLRLEGVGMCDKSGSSVCNHIDGSDMRGPVGPAIPGGAWPSAQQCGAGAWWRSPRVSSASIYSSHLTNGHRRVIYKKTGFARVGTVS